MVSATDPKDGEVLYSLENEMAVIGSLLLGRKVPPRVMPILTAEMFQYAGHAKMFTAIMALHNAGTSVDEITLETELRMRGQFEEIGGRAYLLRCAEVVRSPANIEFYAENVRAYWSFREVEKLGADLQKQMRNPEYTCDLAETLGEAQKRIAGILSATTREGFKVCEIDTSVSRESMPSVFATLNENSQHGGAIVKGQCHVYGAREGVGKSTVLIQEAANLIELGKTGSYYTLADLNQTDIVQRMMRIKTGWQKTPNKPELASLYEQEWAAISDPFSEFRIFTGKQHGYRIDQILGQLLARHVETPQDFAVIDYLQVIDVDTDTRRLGTNDALTMLSKTFERFADRTGIAVIMGAQVTESLENGWMTKGSRGPQEATNLAVFMKRDKDQTDMVRAHVHKFRFGRPLFDFWLHFNKQYLRMEDRGEIE